MVVCGRNKRRSRTAEYIFKNDQRFRIRSVGLSVKSSRQLKETDISWANLILVMEDDHRVRILSSYRSVELPGIEVLHIEDDYAYLDEELIQLLKERINTTLEMQFKL